MRVGIIGGGQLAQMMIQAGSELGISFALLALNGDESAPAICPNVTRVAEFHAEVLEKFIAACDVVTFDHELVDPAVLASIDESARKVFPSSDTLRLAANKARQREMLTGLNIAVPRFVVATNALELGQAIDQLGLRAVAKAAHGGYDGRGVFYLDSKRDVEDLLNRMPAVFELIIEERLELEAEIAVLVARSQNGSMATYPVVRTVQVDSICREVIAPSGIESELEREALDLGMRIAEAVGSIGILAIEMFVVGGRILINELAPRPHNSGHLTIEACITSQFENHLRGVLGLPLGPTELLFASAAMVNILGGDVPTDFDGQLASALHVEGARIHLYHKSYRKGRKLGHVTVVGGDPGEALSRARRSASLLAG